LKPNQYFILSIPSLFLLVLCFQFGLGVDEAHYMLYAKFLDWSYFDHPPLVGWFHLPFNWIFGWNEYSARLPAIILGTLTGIFCYHYLLYKKFSEKKSLLGALSLSGAFLILSLQLFLLPDSFLLPLMFPLIWIVERLAVRSSLLYWIGLGALLGVMGLAKYTAVLFVAPVAIYLVVKRGKKIFLDPGLYLAIGVAALFVLPVFYWNYSRDWISFKYQWKNVSGGGPQLNSLLVSLAGQVGGYNPLLFPFSIAGFLVIWKNKNFLFERLILTLLLFFFVKSSIGKPILPHWTAPFFVLVLPVGVASLNWVKYLRASLIITCLIYLFLLTELLVHFLPVATAGYRDIKGYDKIANDVVEITDLPVAVTNWTYASRIMFYLNGRRALYGLDDRVDQFDIWQKEKPAGQDLLILLFSFDNESFEQFPCRSREDRGTLKVAVKQDEVYSVRLLLCRSYGQQK